MEDVSAAVYHPLLRHHHQCSVTISQAVYANTAGKAEQWKELSHACMSARLVSVVLPVMETELRPYSTKRGPPCRGCGVHYGTAFGSHLNCAYNVSSLLPASAKIEEAIDSQMAKVSELVLLKFGGLLIITYKA